MLWGNFWLCSGITLSGAQGTIWDAVAQTQLGYMQGQHPTLYLHPFPIPSPSLSSLSLLYNVIK